MIVSQRSIGNSLDRRDVLDAGAGHDDVQMAEAVQCGGHRGRVGLGVGEVGFVRRAGPVRVRVEVDGEDVTPVLDHPGGDRAADPAAGAGD